MIWGVDGTDNPATGIDDPPRPSPALVLDGIRHPEMGIVHPPGPRAWNRTSTAFCTPRRALSTRLVLSLALTAPNTPQRALRTRRANPVTARSRDR